METYPFGATVHLTAEFTDSAGNPADPTTVTLRIVRPDGSETALSDAVKDAVGFYHRDIKCSLAGYWTYRFEGTGTVEQVDEDQFQIATTATNLGGPAPLDPSIPPINGATLWTWKQTAQTIPNDVWTEIVDWVPLPIGDDFTDASMWANWNPVTGQFIQPWKGRYIFVMGCQWDFGSGVGYRAVSDRSGWANPMEIPAIPGHRQSQGVTALALYDFFLTSNPQSLFVRHTNGGPLQILYATFQVTFIGGLP